MSDLRDKFPGILKISRAKLNNTRMLNCTNDEHNLVVKDINGAI